MDRESNDYMWNASKNRVSNETKMVIVAIQTIKENIKQFFLYFGCPCLKEKDKDSLKNFHHWGKY